MVKNVGVDVWSLPAGAIDLGESPSQAVVREVFEETGLKVEPQRIVGVFGGKKFRYVYANGDKVEYFVVVFECKTIAGELSAQDGEIAEFQFFAAEEMPKLVIAYPQTVFVENVDKVLF